MSVSASYILTQVPSAAIAAWSFKLHKDTFQSTDGKGFAEHDASGGIFGAGVCMLGKLGAWTIMATLIGTAVMLVVGEQKSPKEFKKYVLAVIIINAVIFGIIMILSTLMNPPLLIRTLPFYSLQAGILCNLVYVHARS